MVKRAGTNVSFVCGLDGGMYKLINFNDAQLNFVFEKTLNFEVLNEENQLKNRFTSSTGIKIYLTRGISFRCECVNNF
jgi:hypothetical protein